MLLDGEAPIWPEDVAAFSPIFEHKDRQALSSAMRVLKVDVRYNTRRQLAEWRQDVEPWISLTDRAGEPPPVPDRREFPVQDQKGHQGSALRKRLWKQCFNAVLYERECDPFLEWLNVLPSGTRCRASRIGYDDCFDLDPNAEPALVAWVSQFVFSGRCGGRMNRARSSTKCRC